MNDLRYMSFTKCQSISTQLVSKLVSNSEIRLNTPSGDKVHPTGDRPAWGRLVRAAATRGQSEDLPHAWER
jgi:hypothetical protein